MTGLRLPVSSALVALSFGIMGTRAAADDAPAARMQTAVNDATGACCLEDDVCDVLTPAACVALGGRYQGDGTSCLPSICERALSPVIGVAPTFLDFGRVCPGQCSDREVLIFNNVQDPKSLLTVTELAAGPAPPFELVNPPPTPFDIPGDGATTVSVTVRYCSHVPEPQSGTFTITSSNATNSPVHVPLSGAGNLPPVCNAGGPYTGGVGQPISFNGAGSYDPEGGPLTYLWDFGDGSTATGATPSHAYGERDIFTVSLTVTDDCAIGTSCQTTATIDNFPPNCNAGGPYSGTVGNPITFDGSGSNDPDGMIVLYEWSFGDGSTDTGPISTHTYLNPGDYTVALCVTDNNTPPARTCCQTPAQISCPGPRGRFPERSAPVEQGKDLHTRGESIHGAPASVAGAPCMDRLYCNSFAEHPDVSWYADGEWRPDGTIGWISTGGTIALTDEDCTNGTVCQPLFDICNGGSVTRAFAWGIGAGDAWVGSWHSPPRNARLAHVDADCNVIAEYEITDPDTGLPLQFSGLAMDTDNGHLWGNLRNHPAGTPSRFVELDINVDPPAIIQGPMVVPWPEGPSIGDGGLEYNEMDCTLIALRQDTGNTPLEGTARVAVFEDQGPGGGGGVTYVSECQITLTAHCTGTADQGNPNHPWGLAVVARDLPYGIFSEINLDAGCAVPAPPAVSDISFFSLPPYSIYSCRDVPVEVTRFDATTVPGGVLLSWEVHSPEDVVGFDVRAARDSNAEYVKRNQELLPGDTREYLDVTDGTSSYQLEIHERDGSTYRHGPIEGTAGASSSVLTQNWPNPFREFTEIHFSAPDGQRVTIDIYDVTGNFVARVYEGTGGRVAKWDGRDAAGQRVAPGVYFYQVNAGGRAFGKKLVVFSGQ